jgi:hypothetical protein
MTNKFQRADGVFDAPLYEATVLLSVETSRYHELNDVGARVWALLDVPKSSDELVAILAAEFEVTPEDCRTDIDMFLASLRHRKLIREL